jgi:hypothetical protein
MDWIWIGVLCGIPLLLTAIACTRYVSDRRALGLKLAVIRTGVLFVIVSTASWLFVFALMVLQDRSTQVKVVARAVSPGPIGLVNLLLCVGAIICARFKYGGRQASSARRALTAAGGFLSIIWLFLLANPH